MAAQFTGMDINAVRQLAQQLNTKADAIAQISQQLTSLLQSTPWVGPDQQRFVNDWQSQHVTALNRVVTGLTDAARVATSNAQQQESASNS